MSLDRAITLAAALIFAAAPAFAQDTQDQSSRRPDISSIAQNTPAAPAARQPGMMGQGTMGPGMMGNGLFGGMMGPGMMSPGMMGGGGMMPMMNMMGAMGPRWGADHVEGRLAFIKAELKITDAQTPQWDAFAASVHVNAKSMSDMHQSMAARQGAATLPERLAQEDKVLTEQLAALKNTEEALDKLYGVLSADQQKLADGIVLGPMGMPIGMM
jgi:hypothetical protein